MSVNSRCAILVVIRTQTLGLTYAFTVPLLDVEEDVVTTFSTITKTLGDHHIILRQPELQLLVIAPIAIVTKSQLDLDEQIVPLRILTYSSWAAMTCWMSPGLL
jgi:hypothetical protein